MLCGRIVEEQASIAAGTASSVRLRCSPMPRLRCWPTGARRRRLECRVAAMALPEKPRSCAQTVPPRNCQESSMSVCGKASGSELSLLEVVGGEKRDFLIQLCQVAMKGVLSNADH